MGKTTTSVSLGAALAESGRRVLVIDLDSQASTSLSLGVPRACLAPSSADVVLQGLPLASALRATRVAGLDLVTASADLASADQELSLLPDRELRLLHSIDGALDGYDDVLIDCPASLSVLALNALAASDAFIVPVVPQFLALEGVQNLLAAADRMWEKWGRRSRLLGLLLTMVDYRTRSNRENVDRIRGEFGARVFAVEIRINIRLAEAPGFGQTIFEHDPSSTGAKAYRLLAEEYLMRTEGVGDPILDGATPRPAAGVSGQVPSALPRWAGGPDRWR